MSKARKLTSCLVLLFVLSFGSLFAINFGNRSVTQYEPYLEWTLNDVTYTGNAFDVIGSVTFDHNSSSASHTIEMFYDGDSTWKFRFSGSELGQWSFTTTSTNPDLNGHTGTITVNVNSDPKVKGYITENGPEQNKKWAWSKDNLAFVPNYDMYTIPSDFYNNPARIDNDITRVITNHGFTGFHVAAIGGWWFDINRGGENPNRVTNTDTDPDIRTFEALELLITRTYKAGGAMHFWIWGDKDRNENLFFHPSGKMGDVEKRLNRYLAARLSALPGWSVGYGFDLK